MCLNRSGKGSVAFASHCRRTFRDKMMSNAMWYFCICSSPVAFITCFVTLFALVIAITKDLPDVEGDRKWVSNFTLSYSCVRTFSNFTLISGISGSGWSQFSLSRCTCFKEHASRVITIFILMPEINWSNHQHLVIKMKL